MTTETTTERPRTKVSTIVDRLFTQLEGTRTSFDSCINDVQTPTEGSILVRWKREGRGTLRDIEKTPAITVTKEDLDGFVFEQESKIENNKESIRLYHWGRVVTEERAKRLGKRSTVKLYLEQAYKVSYGRHSYSKMYGTSQFELPDNSCIHRIVVEVEGYGKEVKKAFPFKDESELQNAITKAVAFTFKNSKVFAPSTKDSRKKYDERSIAEQWAEDILRHRDDRMKEDTIALEEKRMCVFAEQLIASGFIQKRYDLSYDEKPLTVEGKGGCESEGRAIRAEKETEQGLISLTVQVDSDGEYRAGLGINARHNNRMPMKANTIRVQNLIDMATAIK
jgi:hypothetical protein